MADTSIDGKVQRLQAMLYTKATTEPQIRFTTLYKYITRPEWIHIAMGQVLRNRGSRTAGIDGITRTHLNTIETQTQLTADICAELKAGTYTPQPTRRIYIPKAHGKRRPLGIPTIKDRIVQAAVKLLLEPICEARFLSCSYGFRPNRCTWDALADVHQHLRKPCSYEYVIEGDIENCFGAINHSRLMRQLKRFLQDRRLLDLLWKMLRAGVMEDLQTFETTEGTPQGGIVSPLLANIYLHRLDEWMTQRFPKGTTDQRRKRVAAGELAYVRYIRYADDFVVLLRGTAAQAAQLKEEMTIYIDQELGMTLSPAKTLITHATKGFDFLGVRTIVAPLRSNPNRVLPFHQPAPTSIKRYKQRVRELTNRRMEHIPLAERIRALNWLIAGWADYHHWGNAKTTFSTLDHWTTRRVLRRMNRGQEGIKTQRHTRLQPVARCINLKRWSRYRTWKTPAVLLDTQEYFGLLPMGIISTKDYWKPYGANNPSVFALRTDQRTTIQRNIPTRTADEVVRDTSVQTWTDTRYTAGYFAHRQLVFERDNYTCTECGYHTQRRRDEIHDLECHHIDPTQGNTCENMRTVCVVCHQAMTRKQVRQRKR